MSRIFLGHAYDGAQDVKIERQRSKLDATAHQIQSSRSELQTTTQHVDRLRLVCQALWELCSERLGVTEEELEEKVLEIDLRGGKADGKLSVRPLFRPNR